MVSAELVERERQALREATDAQLAGVGQRTIVEEWNAHGLRTAAGRDWVVNSLKAVLLRPTNAGLIEHDGQLVGRIPGEPIVDPDKFARLRAKYAARRRGRMVGERYVGTGTLRCGNPACGITLSAHKQDQFYKGTDVRRAVYFCNKQRRGCGKVCVDVRAVDKELRELVVTRLSDSRYAAAIAAAQAQVKERLDAVNREIAECERIQQGLSAQLGRREMSLDAFDAANEPLVKDLVRLRAERDALSGGNPDGPTRAQRPAEIGAQWDAADISEKRAMLTQALGRNHLRVLPAAKIGKRVFDRNRLRLVDPDEERVESAAS